MTADGTGPDEAMVQRATEALGRWVNPTSPPAWAERAARVVLDALRGGPKDAALALHYEFAEDDCCDPPTYSATCDFVQVCHECGQSWPCDTSLVAAGGSATRPPRNDRRAGA